MQTIQAQPVSRFALAGNSGIERLLAFFAAVLGRSTGVRQDVTPAYEGYAWCDSLEQQVNNDIAICRRAGFQGSAADFPFGSR